VFYHLLTVAGITATFYVSFLLASRQQLLMLELSTVWKLIRSKILTGFIGRKLQNWESWTGHSLYFFCFFFYNNATNNNTQQSRGWTKSL